jgi:hypothetical protein
MHIEYTEGGVYGPIKAANVIQGMIWLDKHIPSLKLNPKVHIVSGIDRDRLIIDALLIGLGHVSSVKNVPYHNVTFIKSEDDILRILHYFEQLYPVHSTLE